MANAETEFMPATWVDGERDGAETSSNQALVDLNSINNLRGALNTADATYFTNTRLNGMTKNDLVFAYRTMVINSGVAPMQATSVNVDPPPEDPPPPHARNKKSAPKK